ncbi:ADAM 17-like protease [Trichonephila clavipes]|nr:ADAM 17-like protease [Trichonephila clavipes]
MNFLYRALPLLGEVGTQVSAHIDDGILTAAIRTSEDTYIVEPSWRHVSFKDNSSMIVYRGSDVKYSWETMETAKKMTKFCTYMKEEGNVSTVEDDTEDVNPKNRSKRQAIDPYNWEPVQTRCSLLLVADFRFYENMGGSLASKTPHPEGSSPYAFIPSLASGLQKIAPS